MPVSCGSTTVEPSFDSGVVEAVGCTVPSTATEDTALTADAFCRNGNDVDATATVVIRDADTGTEYGSTTATIPAGSVNFNVPITVTFPDPDPSVDTEAAVTSAGAAGVQSGAGAQSIESEISNLTGIPENVVVPAAAAGGVGVVAGVFAEQTFELLPD